MIIKRKKGKWVIDCGESKLKVDDFSEMYDTVYTKGKRKIVSRIKRTFFGLEVENEYYQGGKQIKYAVNCF